MTRVARTCTVEGCQRRMHARDLCGAHYQQVRSTGGVSSPSVRPYNVRRQCSVPGCDDTHYSRDVCSRHYQRVRRYGLTVERFVSLMSSPCGICGQASQVQRSLHIDHDHSCCPKDSVTICGQCVRGVLCHGCNTGLGAFRDDPDRLRSAIEYLSGSLIR